MARRARLASQDPGLVLADGKSDRAGQTYGCVAGAPLRSPPRLREDAPGPQRAGLGSPLRVTGAAPSSLQAWVTVLAPPDPRK